MTIKILALTPTFFPMVGEMEKGFMNYIKD